MSGTKLKTDEGDYYSFYQNNWEPTQTPVFDQTKFPNNYPSCNEWSSPPPAVYLSRPLNTKGVEFAHALAITSRCYVLLKDGSFHSWTRDYGVFEMIFLGKVTLLMGMIIGGVLGVRVAKSKYRRQTSY